MVIKSSSRVQAKSASSKATFLPPGEAYLPKETAGVAAGLDTASPSKAKTTGASAATHPDCSYITVRRNVYILCVYMYYSILFSNVCHHLLCSYSQQ